MNNHKNSKMRKKIIKLKEDEHKENLESSNLFHFRKIDDKIYYKDLLKTPEKIKKIKKPANFVINKKKRKRFLFSEKDDNLFKNLENDSTIKKEVNEKLIPNFENNNLSALFEFKNKSNIFNFKQNFKNSETTDSLNNFSKAKEKKIQNISSIFSTPLKSSSPKNYKTNKFTKNNLKKNLNSIFEKIDKKEISPFLVNENDLNISSKLNFKILNTNQINKNDNQIFQALNEKLFSNNVNNEMINCSFLEFSKLFKNVDFIQKNFYE